MNIELNYVSAVAAIAFSEKLSGHPTENRVVIITPTGEFKTGSGIIMPDIQKAELPKKGTIIQIGHISEDMYSYKGLEIGQLVTYGLYAGKEIELPVLGIDPGKWTISVLSLNEIIYIEKQ